MPNGDYPKIFNLMVVFFNSFIMYKHNVDYLDVNNNNYKISVLYNYI